MRKARTMPDEQDEPIYRPEVPSSVNRLSSRRSS